MASLLGVSKSSLSKQENGTSKPNSSIVSSSESSSSSETPTLKVYSDKSSADLLEFDEIMGHSVTEKQLPYIPKGVRKLSALVGTSAVSSPVKPPQPPTNTKNNKSGTSVSSSEEISTLSLTAQEQAHLANLTDTELACYISPPNKNVVKMEGVINSANLLP